jgi:hypothetical protein
MRKKTDVPSTSLPPRPTPRDEQLERLIEKVGHLVGIVTDLTDEVNMLRDAVDDSRQEMESVMRLHRKPPPPPMHITSMPKDPLDPHFHEKVNRLKPTDLPTADAGSAPATQSELF